MRGITVLVIDDEEIVRTVVRRVLEHLGFNVILAVDGREAVAICSARTGEIGCVVLDVTMPGMNAEQTFDALRAMDPTMPIVLTSGLLAEATLPRFEGRGIAGFLQKPYDIATLSTVVAGALEDRSTA